MKTDLLRKIVIGCFILVPLLSSLISTVHLVDFFYLGNPSWISYTIAISIEIGAIASFLTLSILSKLNKIIVWSIFSLLFFMQVVGNIYFSYDWISQKLVEDPNWIKTFQEMMEFFFYEIEESNAKMILSMFIAIPIPLISVFLLKSTVDYLGTDKSPAPDEVISSDDLDKDLVDWDAWKETLAEEHSNLDEIVEQKSEDPGIHISEPRIIGTDPATGGFRYDA
jgi:hypothetical protein